MTSHDAQSCVLDKQVQLLPEHSDSTVWASSYSLLTLGPELRSSSSQTKHQKLNGEKLQTVLEGVTDSLSETELLLDLFLFPVSLNYTDARLLNSSLITSHRPNLTLNLILNRSEIVDLLPKQQAQRHLRRISRSRIRPNLLSCGSPSGEQTLKWTLTLSAHH